VAHFRRPESKQASLNISQLESQGEQSEVVKLIWGLSLLSLVPIWHYTFCLPSACKPLLCYILKALLSLLTGGTELSVGSAVDGRATWFEIQRPEVCHFLLRPQAIYFVLQFFQMCKWIQYCFLWGLVGYYL